MEKYVGTKIIKAAAMNLGDYNAHRGWKIPENENPEKEGYLVEYSDDYQSWSPKDVFEEAYRKLTAEYPEKLHELKVFPSEAATIGVYPDKDYGGAHQYLIKECAGFSDGETQYVNTHQVLQFVKKEEDGSMTPGLQSEQVLLALIDRHVKLNKRFPSVFNEKMIEGMQMAIDAMQERVQDRLDRDVMGELKN